MKNEKLRIEITMKKLVKNCWLKLLGRECEYDILKENFKFDGLIKDQRKFKCLVIMPIGEKGTNEYKNNMRVYEDIIKLCVVNSGYNIECYYADLINESGAIDKQVISALKEDEIVIADLRRSNPSVAYELGIRHTFRKRSIPICPTRSKKWFYTQTYRVVEYKIDGTSNQDFYGKLIGCIDDIIRDPEKSDNPIGDNIALAEEMQPMPEKLSLPGEVGLVGTDDEKNFHTLVAAGMQFERTKRYDLAIECFENALKIKPGDVNLHLALSIIYGERLGDPDSKEKALVHCEATIQIDPSNIVAKFNSAIYTNHLRGPKFSLLKYQEVERMMRAQGLEGTEMEGKLNIFIGSDYRDTGNRVRAESHYDKAIDILKKLSEQGDKSSAFWLNDAEKNLANLFEKISIVSDEKTFFIKTNIESIAINTSAVEAQVHFLWGQSDNRYPELEGAKWIADRPTITNEEALKGGTYVFCREFIIDFEVKQLRSAEICLLVDDFCQLEVNGFRFEKVRGYENIHKFDITKKIINGKNVVHFIVENISAEKFNRPDKNLDFYKSDKKYNFNPYGLKYAISVDYRKY
jgi:tetratricopeptide (TPR) repeat protein